MNGGGVAGIRCGSKGTNGGCVCGCSKGTNGASVTGTAGAPMGMSSKMLGRLKENEG